MIKKSFLLKIFNAACMQRWNDKLRPIDLTEMDKQAHKMMIAYFLGKIEEDKGTTVDWIEIIEGGIYEYLLRSVLTDIKPPIFYKIMDKSGSDNQLKKWAYEEWRLMIEDFEAEGKFHTTFLKYHNEPNQNVNRKILSAAHIMATRWEYSILKKFNHQDYEKTEIKDRLEKEYEKYKDLHGIKMLEAEKGEYDEEEYDADIAKHGNLKKLINLCGQLRFQLRWAHIHRIPKTSVLGHLLFVAIISYLISLESADGSNRYCVAGRFNNFFTGLFHDLPEVLTRDIVSPVKQSIEGLDDIIKEEEKMEMEQKIIKLLPDLSKMNWKDEMRMFTGILDSSDQIGTIEEFDNMYCIKGAYHNLKMTNIPSEFAADEFKPRDGRIVKEADKLAAFIEALVAIENGCSSIALYEALQTIKPKYNQKRKTKEESPTKGAAFEIMREIYTEF